MAHVEYHDTEPTMLRLLVLADRLDLLREIAAIEQDLAIVTHQYGAVADVQDLWRRLHAVRLVVFEQLSGHVDIATIH